MVLTATIPLYAGGEFLGIAGIDLTLQDLFVEIYALDQEVAHGIVLDSLDGRVFAHVLLPEPSTVNNAHTCTSFCPIFTALYDFFVVALNSFLTAGVA